jgi:hypothetical protein
MAVIRIVCEKEVLHQLVRKHRPGDLKEESLGNTMKIKVQALAELISNLTAEKTDEKVSIELIR